MPKLKKQQEILLLLNLKLTSLHETRASIIGRNTTYETSYIIQPLLKPN